MATQLVLPHKGPPYKKKGPATVSKKGGEGPPTGTEKLKSTASMIITSTDIPNVVERLFVLAPYY